MKTGTIVWNQVKDRLESDATKGTLLIYASNIKRGAFVSFSEGKNGKKQFLRSPKPTLTGPVVLMNRGYGNSAYAPDLLFIDETNVGIGHAEFYVENHLNVIYPVSEEGRRNIRGVYEYLNSDASKEYIGIYTGNGAMSKTEISKMLPIILPRSS